MSSYLKGQLENESTGVLSDAIQCTVMIADLIKGTCELRETPYINGEAIRDKKRPCGQHIKWVEPDIMAITDENGTPVYNILLQAFAQRMVTLDCLPGTETPNPFKGMVMTQIPSEEA